MKKDDKLDAIIKKMIKFHKAKNKERNDLIDYLSIHNISKSTIINIAIASLLEFVDFFKNCAIKNAVNWKNLDADKALGTIGTIHLLWVMTEMIRGDIITLDDLTAGETRNIPSILEMIARTGREAFSTGNVSKK